MNRPDFRRHIQTIAGDSRKGASELARDALEIIAGACAEATETADGIEAVTDLARALSECRPAMAPLRNLTRRWLAQMADHAADSPGWLAQGRETARHLQTESRNAVTRIAQHGLAHLAGRTTLMSHSRSSTVRELARAATRRGRRIHWLITRSEPAREGLDLALELAELDHTVAVLTEAQIPLVIREADAVVVGADSILATGELVNKAGTHLLALAAMEQHCPFVCLCESFKFSDLSTFDPEPHPVSELDLPHHAGITGFNFTFDKTPAPLVSAWITEDGLQVNRSAANPWQ
jgi:translation initiation factor 2B subunit (eIF-2B alpha/beta/delta family)